VLGWRRSGRRLEAGAGEDGKPRVLSEGGIGTRELAQDEDGAAGRADAAGVFAAGAQSGAAFVVLVGR
jgi:hypothetical protein